MNEFFFEDLDKEERGKFTPNGNFIWSGFARDKDHALKIARDYKAKKLSELNNL